MYAINTISFYNYGPHRVAILSVSDDDDDYDAILKCARKLASYIL